MRCFLVVPPPVFVVSLKLRVKYANRQSTERAKKIYQISALFHPVYYLFYSLYTPETL